VLIPCIISRWCTTASVFLQAISTSSIVLLERNSHLFELVLPNFLNEPREAHHHVDLPELPQTLSLDIRQVISSPYFFP